MDCELVNADDLKNQLRILKSINVDGVKVNCWWGIVEAHASQQYNWGGYKKLFEIVRDLKLKLQVIVLKVMILPIDWCSLIEDPVFICIYHFLNFSL